MLISGGLAVAGLIALVLSGDSARVALLGDGLLQATQVEGEAFPKRLIDPLGVAQTLEAPPQRIVSTILAGDQILTALVEVHRLAGVTAFVDNPGISNIVGVVPPSVPRLYTNTETILALQPDLVLMAGFTRAETVKLLVAAGIPVVRFQTYDAFSDIVDNIRLLGSVLGAEEQATQLIAHMRHRVAAVEQRVVNQPRPRVYYYGSGGYTMGAETMIDDMITRAGGLNVAREINLTGPSRLQLEVTLSLAPEIIIMADWSDSPAQDAVQELQNNPAWHLVPAVQHGRVYAIRGAWLESVSQYAVNGLEAIARILHPEKPAS